MKKIILLAVLLAFIAFPVYADSIKPVKIVDDNNDTCIDETNNLVKSSLYDNSGAYVVIEDDSTTGSLKTIDYSHHEVHDSSHFFYKDIATLAANASTSYLIQTPDTTKWAHLTFSATGSAITQADLYEGGDLSGTGARQVIVNNNRNSNTASGLTIWDSCVDGTTNGTLIYAIKSGASAGASRSPGIAERSNEIILKQNTKYLLRVTSGTNDNLTNLLLEWYEHTNR